MIRSRPIQSCRKTAIGSDAVIYGLGVNYNRQNGVMKKSYREVFGVSFDLTYRIRDKVNIRNSFEFTQTNVQNSP